MEINNKQISKSKLKGKRILVTGSCGTVGSELIRQLLENNQYAPKEVIGIDTNESALFFQDQENSDNDRASFFVTDIRDKDAILDQMRGIDIVFHAAALKHVILCERSPTQTVQTNIKGVQNIISAANFNNVEIVIFTSSDKAVNPTNVMGTSKLMGERLMTAAFNASCGNGQKTIFTSTRFGNVLGSNGSVIPIFRNQISKGGPVTLTDKNMTRFVMSVQESVRLIIDSAEQAKGGEVFVTKMPVIRIEDLAIAMIEELAPVYGRKPEDIEIVEIGSKPGEKLYEELMSTEETRRTIELKQYFSILPAFRTSDSNVSYTYKETITSNVTNPYISEEEYHLQIEEIKVFLKDNKII
jgi:FlaA1/EpsC-like NDP-sugar epimerase